LIQQSPEEWMVEQTNLDYISLVVLSHVHNQVTLWNITWNIGTTFMQRRPPSSFTTFFTRYALVEAHFLALVEAPSKKS